MIKSFKNYTIKQRFINGFTQWEKHYDDGQTAWVCVDNVNCTRALVIAAFKAQESGLDYGNVFTLKDALVLGLM